jgi:hypothetical protein
VEVVSSSASVLKLITGRQSSISTFRRFEDIQVVNTLSDSVFGTVWEFVEMMLKQRNISNYQRISTILVASSFMVFVFSMARLAPSTEPKPCDI